ncbi:stage IV sporulation protein FB [Sedimentibacter acidaminivorans]|uniref:Stage IV sporulation protein FB n=1 Tax=Sedimentibacter acidaminivorans TaxID=913099 RepID=A0ABS4GB87_9FIRM|nr:site-2 protease family protein [Sedimentibacter acidaminivorans]MBP1924937.1 stage IV sporulation protein FB [Sedimentibacter acidaminivorans]
MVLIVIALTIHEVGHLVAAVILKIKFQRIKITLFGFNLNANLESIKLGNKILLFFSGPFLNLVMFFILADTDYNDFADINIFLAVVNMIPVIPLDGGNICKAILEKILDGISVSRYMIMTNCFFIVCFSVIIYIRQDWFYFVLIIMAVRGIMEENRYLFEKSIKYNYYKKFRKR